MRKFISIFLFSISIILFLRCNDQKRKYAFDKKAETISIISMLVVNIDYYYKKWAKAIIKKKHTIKDINVLYSKKIFIQDTLHELSRDILIENHKLYPEAFYEVDSLFHQIINSKTPHNEDSTLIVNMYEISKKCNRRIYNMNEFEKDTCMRNFATPRLILKPMTIPIFDSTKTKACLYVGISHCGFLCFESYYFFLEKYNGKWIIRGKVLDAMS